MLVSKFMLHQPLNRQSDTFAREGIAIDTSTLAIASGPARHSPPSWRRLGVTCCRPNDPRRRHHGAGAGQREDRYGAVVDLRAGRSAVWWRRPADGSLSLLGQSLRRVPARASGRLRRHHAGRRLCGLQRPLRRQAQASPCDRSGVLVPGPPSPVRPHQAHQGGRSPPRRCAASTRSLPSNAPFLAGPRPSASRCACQATRQTDPLTP